LDSIYNKELWKWFWWQWNEGERESRGCVQ